MFKRTIYSIIMICILTLNISLVSALSEQFTIEEKKFLDNVNKERAIETLYAISENIGSRVAATKEEKQAADYVFNQFQSLGYNVKVQEFKYDGQASSTLKVNDLSIKSYACYSSNYTKETIVGELVDCNTGKVSDIKNKNLNGKIALIKRGDITFNEKVRNASKYGASGIILYNNDSGVVIPGLASNKNYAPAVCITEEDGNILHEKIKANENIKVSLDVIKGDEVTSWNVIATKEAKNNDSKIVYISAHIDNAILSLGANDNASGVAAMLEIARNIKDIETDKEVRFLACGSEEIGLLGSEEYVNSLTEDEINRSMGNFNLDMVATNYKPCSELAVYTSNGEENIVTDYIKKAGEKLSYLSNETINYNGDFDGKEGSSDHQSFYNVGIPSALLINIDPNKRDSSESNLEPYYHKPEDNISNISADRLERSVKLAGIAILNMLMDK